MKLRSLLALLAWLVLCYAVAAFGAQFTPGEWYAALEKPPWNPPNWVFAPVWTALYTMMAVAAWLVWQRRAQVGADLALRFFLVQLALNGLWSWLFFGLQAPLPALLDIALLWLTLAATTALFFRQHAVAGWLMLPYVLWVTYAVSLNAAIVALNR